MTQLETGRGCYVCVCVSERGWWVLERGALEAGVCVCVCVGGGHA